MGKRTFTLTMDIEATSEEQILNTYGIGKLIDKSWCWDFEIKDPEKRHREVILKRYKDHPKFGECFILQSKWSDESDNDFGIEEVYEVDDCDKINYHILGKLKEYKRNWGIDVIIV